MRILYHHRTLGDGAESIHIDEMVEAFRGLGHEVEVRGLAASPQGRGRRGVISGVRRVLPGVAFELGFLACNVPEYVDIRREIRRCRPDFLYKRHARYDVGALSAAHTLGVPTVLEVNCLYSHGPYYGFEPLALGALARRLERRALELASVIVAVSTPLARQIHEQMPSTAPVVMPNGVNSKRFDPHQADAGRIRARYGLGRDGTVGWAGILREWHGLDLLLDAVAAVPSVRLLIVGDGPARQQVEQRAAALGIAERVAITGRVAHAEMPDHLAAMDIAVIAHDRTGVASPMKLLEYMAMGVATIAPNLENIRDLVSDEVDGLLFAPGDSRDLARAVRRLATDEALRRRLGECARGKAAHGRTWRHNAETVVEMVRHGAAAQPGAAAGGALRSRHV